MRRRVVLLMLLMLAGATASGQRRPLVARELVPGASVERALAKGETHVYRLHLKAGQFLRANLEARDIAATISLLLPDGGALPDGGVLNDVTASGKPADTVSVAIVAEADGAYRLTVRAAMPNASAGRYRLQIEPLRAALPEDKRRAGIERLYAEGRRLYALDSEDALRQASAKYQAALALQQAGDDLAGVMQSQLHLGEIYYYLGEMNRMLDASQQALRLAQQLRAPMWQAKALSNIGTAYNALGDNQQALDVYRSALPLYDSFTNPAGHAIALNNLAALYSLRGEKQKALDCYRQALALHQKMDEPDGRATVIHNRGTVYRSLGDAENARRYYEQALALRRAIRDRVGIAVSLSGLSKLDLDAGEATQAQKRCLESLALYRAAAYADGQADVLNTLGKVYQSLGDHAQALACYEEATGIYRRMSNRAGEAATLHNVGASRGEAGAHVLALKDYEQALALRQAVGDRIGEAATLYAIARSRQALGQLIEARARFEDALALVESLRGQVAGDELRAAFLASNEEVYKSYLGLLMQLHARQPGEGFAAAALHVSERARARGLLDLLKEAREDIRNGVEPQLLERETQLRRQLNAKAVWLARSATTQTDEQAGVSRAGREGREGLADLLTEYQTVQAEIRAASPRYAALTQPQPLSLGEIQQQVLDPDSLLLEYALGKERSYLWAVTPTEMTVYELPKRAEMEAAAIKFSALLKAGNKRELRSQVKLAAAELSRMALGPVADKLGGKRLLIVTDGALQYIPFGALVTKKNQPLIVEHEIVHLPSASALAVLRKELAGRQPAGKAVAVLADPVLQENDPRIKKTGLARRNPAIKLDSSADSTRGANDDLVRSARETGVASLKRLPFTRREAEAIAALTGANTRLKALDFDASKTTAMSPDLSQFRIVHFATHGLLNSQHPELSGIVLSLVDERGQPQDGFLRLHDIFNMKLNAEMVVLSACQTALGKDVKGEGLMGLTRGFMYAGAARVVASLWDVRDEATAELMKRFYRGMLKDNLRPAAALRAAQISMWKDARWGAPYYWAGFVLQGEWK